MAEYSDPRHDVLVIGAGGAGLRARHQSSAAGVSVGLVCKSLLGQSPHGLWRKAGRRRDGQRRRPRRLPVHFRRHHARRPVPQ